MTIIYFILILGIIVCIHEFGHFLFAKKAGIYVYEFSIGMGPRLFKWKRKNDETEYSIRLLPIGGYVQMAGEDLDTDAKSDIPKDKMMQNKKWYQRFLTIVAGVMFNFILAIVLLFVIALINGAPYLGTKIGEVTKKSPAEEAGLEVGDKIVQVNHVKVSNSDRLMLEVQVNYGKETIFTVEKTNGEIKEITIIPKKQETYQYGFELHLENEVKEVTKKSPAEQAGLEAGDKIVQVNNVTVNDSDGIMSEIQENYGEEITFTVEKQDGETKEVKIKPEKQNDETYQYGFGLQDNSSRNILEALKYAFGKTISLVEQMIFIICYLFTGKLSLNSLSGPVGIFQVVGETAKTGILNVIYLIAYMSINVGFINLLPIPAFDGGRLLFLIIEKIKRSPVSPKVENAIHSVGFILLMILMIVITYNDIIRLIH